MKPSTEAVFQTYADRLFAIAFTVCQNREDAEDAMQDTLIRYSSAKQEFESMEHIKAWLIRVATNICRDMVRFRLRHPKISVDELENSLAAPEHRETLRELLELPVKQKTVIYLHYVEGYQIKEIAEILGITEGAVKMRLCRAREQMRLTWGSG